MTDKYLKCPHCGRSVAADWIACAECGTRLTANPLPQPFSAIQASEVKAEDQSVVNARIDKSMATSSTGDRVDYPQAGGQPMIAVGGESVVKASIDTSTTVHDHRSVHVQGQYVENQTVISASGVEREAVLDLQAQIRGQGENVQRIGQDVQKLLEQHQLSRRELRPGDSLSIRNDRERELVRELVARYRALPAADRDQVPALLNAIGKLEVVAGDFEAAKKDFQTVADLDPDERAKAEAYFNAYRAALERRDWPGAIQELTKAVKLDPKRFAPFPAGKYQPLRILGAGGFGVAFLCKHKYLDAQVVVKALTLDTLGRDADNVFSEAQVLRELDHPAVIRISDCGYSDPVNKSRAFLVMDYFDGCTLEEYVKTHGPLTVAELLAVAGSTAEGLHAAHGRNILHRDMKPANLMIKREETVWKVKVIDFGLALRQKVVQSSTSTGTGRRNKTLVGESIAGTMDYAAPEQLGKRAEPVSPASDVYGWAKTCCYALFQTTLPTLRHWQSVPAPLADLLGRCLEDDPKRRPQGFREVLSVLDGLAVASVRTSPLPPPAAPSVFEFNVTPDSLSDRRPATSPQEFSPSRLAVLVGGGVALLILLAVVTLGLSTRPKAKTGTVVIEVDQPGAEVYVDGERHDVTRVGDAMVAQVEVAAGNRQLRVVRNGFETFSREFSVKSGATETIHVRLQRKAVASKVRPQAPPTIPEPNPPSNVLTPGFGKESAVREKADENKTKAVDDAKKDDPKKAVEDTQRKAEDDAAAAKKAREDAQRKAEEDAAKVKKAREDAAASLLKQAKLLEANDARNEGILRLQELLKIYPETPAAKKGKELLAEWNSK